MAPLVMRCSALLILLVAIAPLKAQVAVPAPAAVEESRPVFSDFVTTLKEQD